MEYFVSSNLIPFVELLSARMNPPSTRLILQWYVDADPVVMMTSLSLPRPIFETMRSILRRYGWGVFPGSVIIILGIMISKLWG